MALSEKKFAVKKTPNNDSVSRLKNTSTKVYTIISVLIINDSVTRYIIWSFPVTYAPMESSYILGQITICQKSYKFQEIRHCNFEIFIVILRIDIILGFFLNVKTDIDIISAKLCIFFSTRQHALDWTKL